MAHKVLNAIPVYGPRDYSSSPGQAQKSPLPPHLPYPYVSSHLPPLLSQVTSSTAISWQSQGICSTFQLRLAVTNFPVSLSLLNTRTEQRSVRLSCPSVSHSIHSIDGGWFGSIGVTKASLEGDSQLPPSPSSWHLHFLCTDIR